MSWRMSLLFKWLKSGFFKGDFGPVTITTDTTNYRADYIITGHMTKSHDIPADYPNRSPSTWAAYRLPEPLTGYLSHLPITRFKLR